MSQTSPKRTRPAALAADAAVAAKAPAGASGSPAPVPVVPPELTERRRFNRPIPAAQVIESSDADGWDLWHKWSENP